MTELPKGEATEVEEDDGEGGTCSFAMDNDGSGKDGFRGCLESLNR